MGASLRHPANAPTLPLASSGAAFAGLIDLVRAVCAPCECEVQPRPRHEECVGKADRGWILDNLLNDEQRAMWERVHATRLAS